jgi:RimJ/RimL family protein N-acetyltransferase
MSEAGTAAERGGAASAHDVRLRAAEPGDAPALLALKRQLDRETSFMLIEPGERTDSQERIAADLAGLTRATNSVVIVAETPAGLVGYVDARGGEFRRNRITAYVVIGVLAAASGQGVGAALLRELDSWASAHGIRRLELTVMADNERAARLYERMGYVVEGCRRQCLLVDGRPVDELYMARLLP